MTRYTTTGNSRPHIVHHGYQDRPRVPGPLEPMEPLDNTSWRAWARICLIVAAVWFLALAYGG